MGVTDPLIQESPTANMINEENTPQFDMEKLTKAAQIPNVHELPRKMSKRNKRNYRKLLMVLKNPIAKQRFLTNLQKLKIWQS